MKSVGPGRKRALLALGFVVALAGCGGNRPTGPQVELDERRLTLTVADTSMVFAAIPGGRLQVGSDADAGTTRTIPIAGFWMGTTEITCAQWQALSGEAVPASGGDLPRGGLSWQNCQEFVATCNARLAGTPWQVRQPTECEWEYACRAGSTGDFNAATLAEVAWFSDNSGYRLHPVATRQPNEWGLYDCHGNVWEWCSDVAIDARTGEAYDGGAYRILRGGSCVNQDWDCRSARRWWAKPGLSDPRFGLRLIIEPRP